MPGCKTVCFSVGMMNRIMTTRTAALALAAPLFFAAPAIAQKPGAPKHYAPYSYSYGHSGYAPRKYGRKDSRHAARLCRSAISYEAKRAGFRDVDFDDGYYVDRARRGGLRVTFREVEFEGYRRELERPMSCVVDRGAVRWIDDLPRPRHYKRTRVGYYYR